ncbi:MAG: hypothetical protein S4CHLAM102_03880 [Chlamydiia bacterium]|nr:hypothetical protein [Chlamydiia bacterium]
MGPLTLLFTLCFTLFGGALFADNNYFQTGGRAKKSQFTPFFPYLKVGGASPENLREINGMVGLGGRYQSYFYGLDLSLNIETQGSIETLILKAVPLLYPFPNQESQVFIGLGGGVTRGESRGEDGSAETSTSAELLFGREFLRDRPIKTFLQFELSHPVDKQTIKDVGGAWLSIRPMGPWKGIRPSIALAGGVGF